MYRLALLAFAIVLSFSTNAQELEFQHGLGFSYLYVFEGGELSNGTVGITYAPRLGFLELSKESSLSFNITPTLGISGGVSSREESDLSVSYELPASINYNIGYKATQRSRSGAGGFVGLGYGFTNIRNASNTDLLGNVVAADKVNGPYGELGGRFEFRTPGMRKKRMDPVSMTVSVYTIRGKDSSIGGLRFIANLN